jgi:hypothetical protein
VAEMRQTGHALKFLIRKNERNILFAQYNFSLHWHLFTISLKLFCKDNKSSERPFVGQAIKQNLATNHEKITDEPQLYSNFLYRTKPQQYKKQNNQFKLK